MNVIGHYRSTRNSEGILVSLMSVLPDVFLFTKWMNKKYSYMMHNTVDGLDKAYQLSYNIGTAFRYHYTQDMQTHDYNYDWKDIATKDSIMLFSSGLDSFIQWRLLGEPRAIYFALGHKAQERELENIKRINQNFGNKIIIDYSLNWLSEFEMSNAYIPYRNLLFIIRASYYSKNVIIAQVSEWAPDKSRPFYRRVERLMKMKGAFQGLDSSVKIHSPFSQFTKTELVGMYKRRWDVEDLKRYSTSCYSGMKINCGRCTACINRNIAMVNNGINEEYETRPDLSTVTSRWNIKDFRFYNIPMYVRRWKEINEYKRNCILCSQPRDEDI